MTIPASKIVNVLPGVIGTGGNPLALNAVLLTADTDVPIGTVLPFSSTDEVKDFFGPSSDEGRLAGEYFAGFDNSSAKPGKIYFAQYNAADVAAYLRGGSLEGMTLTQLQGLSGSVIVSIDGTPHTGSSIDLSTATSFSDAATIIGTALSAAVTYNSQLQAFVITSGSTGPTSSVAFATGTIADDLKLQAAQGAVQSPGADMATPGTAMDAVKAVTMNWATFMTVFEPSLDDRLAFAVWTNGQNERFLYIECDLDSNAIIANNVQSFGAIAKANAYSACCAIYGPVDKAAFVCGAIASIDFQATQGRTSLAFKSQAGLTFDVGDENIGDILIENGYNFYGEYATANQDFVYFYPGQVSGEWKWLDSYINQIYLNSQFQLSLMQLLTTARNVPYNPFGQAMILQAMQGPINEALNFGTIQPNVKLSPAQVAEVNQQAGTDVATVLSTRGWYAQVKDADPNTRSQRKSPPCNFWYTDGQTVQQITLSSINVQ